MRYEASDKHCTPWQPGRRGTMCESGARDQADALLAQSVEWEGQRYATDGVRAFKGAEHGEGVWHGWPVGWMEVPEPVWRGWLLSVRVKRADIRKWWRLNDD